MNALLDVLNRYPGLWTIMGPMIAALLWAIVSGAFNTLYDAKSPHSDPEWAAFFVRHPRWGGVVSVMKTAGFNLPGLLRSLRVLFGGPLPKPIAAVFDASAPPSARQVRQAALDAARVVDLEQRSSAVAPVTEPKEIQIP